MASVELRECIGNGLRPRRDMARDPRFCREYLNLMPLGPVGARTLQQVTYPLSSPALSVSWPLPQIQLSEKLLMYFGSSALYSVALSDFTATARDIFAATQTINNRRFDTTTGWTTPSGWAITSGAAVATGATSNDLSYAGVLTNAVTYLITFTMTRSAGSITPTFGTQAGTTRSTSGTFTEEVVSDGTDFSFNASGFTGTIDNISIVPKSSLSSTAAWHFVAFQDRVWFASDGASFLYVLPSNPKDGSSRDIVCKADNLTVAAVGKHNNALVLGGLGGTKLSESAVAALFAHWRAKNKQNLTTTEDDTLDDTYIFYSEPGGLANDLPYEVFMASLGYPGAYEQDLYQGIIYSQIEQGGMGFYRPRFAGSVRTVRQLGDELVVYGSNGVTRLVRGENGYVENHLLDSDIPGVPCRTAVAGDEKEHYVLCNHKSLYRLRPGQPAELLEYDEHLSALTMANVVATWDPLRRYAHFCDDADGYIFTGFGLGRTDAVRPTSLFRLSNTVNLYGVAVAESDPQPAQIVGPIVSMPNRQTFEVSDMDVVCMEGSAATFTANCDYRMRVSDQFRRPNAVDVPDRGRVPVKKTGVDIRPVLIAASYKNASVDAINLNLSEGKPSLANIMAGTDTILNETSI